MAAFAWRYLDARGGAAGWSEPFADRAEAEEWLGLEWRDLLERGVEEVELVERGGAEGLYRMSLRDQ